MIKSLITNRKPIYSLAIAAVAFLLSAQHVHAADQALTDHVKPVLKYSARDSTTFSKDKSILSLYGDAKLSDSNFQLTADEISYNKTTQKVIAKGFSLLNNTSKVITKGKYAEFHFNAKTGLLEK